jgi:hypothetical protein
MIAMDFTIWLIAGVVVAIAIIVSKYLLPKVINEEKQNNPTI